MLSKHQFNQFSETAKILYGGIPVAMKAVGIPRFNTGVMSTFFARCKYLDIYTLEFLNNPTNVIAFCEIAEIGIEVDCKALTLHQFITQKVEPNFEKDYRSFQKLISPIRQARADVKRLKEEENSTKRV